VKVGASHLTYCTNIHPGESWQEVRANLGRYLPEVKRRVSPGAPFGVGLRLSALAAESLRQPGTLDEFSGFLRENDLYVFTLNGFPYGPFHGTRVKEDVYLPDWRDEARLDYTNRLADLLAQWLPSEPGSFGSISTVPGAFKPHAATEADVTAITEKLLRHVAHLVALRQATGHRIALGLEPEPCCFLETIAETVTFFRERLYADAAAQRLVALTGLDAPAARRALREHLGICLDLCHAAVEFEDPVRCLWSLEDAGIAIVKIQVTAGLRMAKVTEAGVEALRAFDDAVYLHQVVERRADRLSRYSDLAPAIDSGDWRDGHSEWRVHFHVPVFLDALEGFSSTQGFVREVLAQQKQRTRSPHLEVETYTWSVLPPRHRDVPVAEAISRELLWVRSLLS
jgi:sugar phosphate isomerase/epimerase